MALNKNIPTKRIIFPAILPLEKGDFARVYILKGEYKSEKTGRLMFSDGDDRSRHFVERDYLEEESAFKIEKLRDKRAIATYIYKSENT